MVTRRLQTVWRDSVTDATDPVRPSLFVERSSLLHDFLILENVSDQLLFSFDYIG